MKKFTSWGWFDPDERTALVWGVSVNMDTPITGVASANRLDSAIFDSPAIDLAWDEHNAECRNADHDACGPYESGDQLLGSWKKGGDGLWDADPNAPGAEWAAIYRPNTNTLQVVWSKHTRLSYPCSPCYPGQGDLDTDGDLLAYDVPPWAREEDDE